MYVWMMLSLLTATLLPLSTCAGAIKPGKRLHFAAACTLSQAGIAPEADPSMLAQLRARLAQNADGMVSHLKPPIPARYRNRVYSKLCDVLSPVEARILHPPCRG